MKQNSTMKRLGTAVIGAALMATAADPAQAITVLWGAPQAINSNLDIINPGNVVRAVNFAPSSQPASINVNVDGHIIAFTQTGVTGGTGFHSDTFFVDDNPAAGSVAGDTTSEFHQVLDSFRDNGNSSVTFTGLTAGETYFLQAFQSDDRGNRTVNWEIAGVATSFVSNATFFRSAFAIATVTLDGGETSFTFTRTGGAGVQVNAVVLSQEPLAASIPEPASVGLLALAAASLVRRSRRLA